ncbi:MAG: zinc-binding protein [Paeniclostridium sordellii]|nr:zinc-binding protein [Clostridium perfringens]MDU1456220.1 zinc-binding protein [Paeniclostridium sordellii]
MKIEEEYQRIKSLFDGVDEKVLSLIDGAILESARIKVELDDMHEIVKESNLIKVNKENPSLQKELPISKLLTKQRANYINYISKLAGVLGRTEEEEEDELGDYE